MINRPYNLRCERKFLPHGRSLGEILAQVDRHPALFREVYPPRTVNNLYLDSPSLKDYHDHVGGVAWRGKSRIRWYGALNGRAAAPLFEHKFKRGSVSGKNGNPLPELLLERGVDAFLSHLIRSADLPAPLRQTVRHLQPALLNRYHRHYFLSADGRFRLTVDSDLQFHHPSVKLNTVAWARPSDFEVVIEVKFAPEHAVQAERITNALPFRMARCSKYVLGIEQLRHV